MLANIISALDADRFETIVVSPPGDTVGLFEKAGAKVYIAPRPIHQFHHSSGSHCPIWHPRFLRELLPMRRDRGFWCDYARKLQPQVIHLNALTLAPMATGLRRVAKTICLVQETFVPGLLGLRSSWLRHLLSTAMDAVVFISEYDKQQARCRAPIVEVIPNWVDMRKFDRNISKESAKLALGIPATAKVILMMGGVSEIKGTLPLLQAFAQINPRESVLLLIAGYNQPPALGTLSTVSRWRLALRQKRGKDYHTNFTTFLKVHNLQPSVRFVGAVTDVVPLYAVADIVVFPAVEAHQARPVLEAGAMAKPVVVSAFPNLSEFVQDGYNGLLVPPADSAALAKALARLLRDPAHAGQLGANNYAMTQAKNNQAHNAPRFARLYEKLIASSTSLRPNTPRTSRSRNEG